MIYCDNYYEMLLLNLQKKQKVNGMEKYIEAEIEIISINSEDVITTSDASCPGDDELPID